MIDPNDIHQRPNISRILQRRIRQMRPDADQAAGIRNDMACSLLISRGRIICAMPGLLPNCVSSPVCETITGRVVTLSAASVACILACARSIRIPSRLHSLMTDAPKAVNPP